MKISALAHEAGLPVATVKYYLREGLLPAGEATSATQARYDDRHLHRLRVIRALVEVAGLPLARAKQVLAAVDEPGPDPYAAVARAVEALPPYAEPADPACPRATALLEQHGLDVGVGSTALTQLEVALRGLEAAGRPLDPEAAGRYLADIRSMAEREVASVGRDPGASLPGVVEDVVLGTTLIEPVILAMRRVMHQALYRERTERSRPGHEADTLSP
ncbi:DNA-binding transcriptional MerR regulator [Mumia flava]|uniref:DNA-binding transcriptional MerR regulator n=1 Tax=Mumia flava TaxID=1348852 RepID=A0A0B2B6B0_9ACTN|nr:MerR family transcriptional regulator [Mumia flava]PJJ53920.1 DNA-binding transcriptional MerR regulator [Mumia flava]